MGDTITFYMPKYFEDYAEPHTVEDIIKRNGYINSMTECREAQHDKTLQEVVDRELFIIRLPPLRLQEGEEF